MVAEIPERVLWTIIILCLCGMATIMLQKESSQNYQIVREQSPISKTHSKQRCLSDICYESLPTNRRRKKHKSKKESPPTQNSEHPLIVHSKTTKVVSRVIGLKYYSSMKGHGLFVKEDVQAGEILFIEKPLLKIDKNAQDMEAALMMKQMNKAIKSHYISDREFAVIWDNLAINRQILGMYKAALEKVGIIDQSEAEMKNFAKVKTNQFSGHWRRWYGVYAILSKINFGLPQNVAVVLGDESDDHICVVVATKDIKAGDELVTDYFFDWFDYASMSTDKFDKWMQRRILFGTAFEYRQTKKWRKIIKALNADKKYKIAMKELYPNGVIGRAGHQKEIEMVPGSENNDIGMKIKYKTDQLIEILRGKNDDEIHKIFS